MRLLLALVCLSVGGCVAVPMVGKKEAVVFSTGGWPKQMEAHVYRPKAGGKRPAVLLLHGGGLKDDGGRWQMDGIARKLVKRGYVVVNATYRTAPKYQYPVPVEDVTAALEWMKREGAEYGIDRKRIATFGYSAGGYLAALVALKDRGEDRVKAIVAGGAPADLVFYAEGESGAEFFGREIV